MTTRGFALLTSLFVITGCGGAGGSGGGGEGGAAGSAGGAAGGHAGGGGAGTAGTGGSGTAGSGGVGKGGSGGVGTAGTGGAGGSVGTGGTGGAGGGAGTAGTGGAGTAGTGGSGTAGTGGAGTAGTGGAGTAGTGGSGTGGTGGSGTAGTGGSGTAGTGGSGTAGTGGSGTGGTGGAGGTGGSGTGGTGGAGGITIRVHYDTGFGNSIVLRGSGAGLDWNTSTPCTWSANDAWLCELAGAKGPVEYKPLFAGGANEVWALGSNWILQGATEADVYPMFFATAGQVSLHENWYSHILDNSRTVAVFLPPSYAENPYKKYPLLFFQDGHNLFDANTAAFGVEWQLDETLTHLARTAGIEEAIVVAPYPVDRTAEYTPSVDTTHGGGDAESYLNFLTTELLPWAQSTYRVDTSRALGIAGSSLGGLLSLYACWTRPAQFHRCGVFSPSLWWSQEQLLNTIKAATTRPTEARIHLDMGDQEAASSQALAEELRQKLIDLGWVEGLDLHYELGVGHGHNEAAWAARAPAAMEFLYQDPQRL